MLSMRDLTAPSTGRVMHPEAQYNGSQEKVVSSKSERSGLQARASHVVQVDIFYESPTRISTSSCNEAMLHLSIMEPNKLKNDKPCVCQVFVVSHIGGGDSRPTVYHASSGHQTFLPRLRVYVARVIRGHDRLLH